MAGFGCKVQGSLGPSILCNPSASSVRRRGGRVRFGTVLEE
eukprot:SAG31_NODE_22378_length_527_cov_0.717290_1_plen_40_part_01